MNIVNAAEQPLRQSTGAYAIIKARIDDDDKFLLQWNSKWHAYNFIGGHFDQELDGCDYERTISREVEEELPGLKRGRDFIVQPLLAKFWEANHWSKSTNELTHYRFRVYRLVLLKTVEEFNRFIQATELTKWFNLEELSSGRGADGEHISTFPLQKFVADFGLASLPCSTP